LPSRLFGRRELDRGFVRQLVDAGIANRIADTAYFEPLAGEDDLHVFLESEGSPFRGVPDLSADLEEGGLKFFVSTGAAVLSQFDARPNSNDGRAALSILMVRYAFNRRYREFSFRAAPDQNFINGVSAIGDNAQNLGFQSGAYRDTDMDDVFGACREAVGWFQTLLFQLAPVDMAFAIFKVHEALALIATGAEPDAVHERRPGFDDIFGLWAAVLIAGGIPDPRGILNFVNQWAALPGFPKKFLACCAYMEAALAHIVAFGQDTDEQ
jgi:hypothetical protein